MACCCNESTPNCPCDYVGRLAQLDVNLTFAPGQFLPNVPSCGPSYAGNTRPQNTNTYTISQSLVAAPVLTDRYGVGQGWTWTYDNDYFFATFFIACEVDVFYPETYLYTCSVEPFGGRGCSGGGDWGNLYTFGPKGSGCQNEWAYTTYPRNQIALSGSDPCEQSSRVDYSLCCRNGTRTWNWMYDPYYFFNPTQQNSGSAGTYTWTIF